jgi:hypothetical protein
MIFRIRPRFLKSAVSLFQRILEFLMQDFQNPAELALFARRYDRATISSWVAMILRKDGSCSCNTNGFVACFYTYGTAHGSNDWQRRQASPRRSSSCQE